MTEWRLILSVLLLYTFQVFQMGLLCKKLIIPNCLHQSGKMLQSLTGANNNSDYLSAVAPAMESHVFSSKWTLSSWS